jgi:hypothetical protein
MRSIALCTMLCLSSAGLMAHEEQRAEKVSITSLNQPDPVFVPSGDQVSVNVRARSANTLRKLVVTLDGRNVTHSFSLVDSHSMTATIAGLRPGMNTFEVFMNKGDKRPAASLKVAAALSPAAACSAASFPVNALSGMNVAIVSATPVAATATVPEHCLVNGTIDAGRVGYPSSADSAGQCLYLCHQMAGAPAECLERKIRHTRRRWPGWKHSQHDRRFGQWLCRRGQ